MSAKTRSWEQAELISRKYENKAERGEEIKADSAQPTVKDAVSGYLADAQARGLAESTMEKLRQIFRKQLLGFAQQHQLLFLRELNVRNMTQWRSTWTDKPLARKKKFERVPKPPQGLLFAFTISGPVVSGEAGQMVQDDPWRSNSTT
jgi:hypothetical protein